MLSFLDEVNSYFSNKEFLYNLGSSRKSSEYGLQIRNTIQDKMLSPDSLSSGERQLILMLTLVAIKRTRPTLFFIDEPEISLSSTWQRKLEKSLKKLSDSNIQFLIATHSIEILSGKVDQVATPQVINE